MDFHPLIVREEIRSGASLASTRHCGRQFPEFLLPDESGWLTWSRELLAQGPFVLSFFHGGWCEACMARLKQFDACRHRFHAMGVSLVAVSPDTGPSPRDVKRRHNLEMPILSDVDNALGRELEITFRVPQPLLAEMQQHGIDLVQRHGSRHGILPAASTFAVDRDGVIIAESVERDSSAPHPDVLIACFEKLRHPDHLLLSQHDRA
jgi:peroxiredoxin